MFNWSTVVVVLDVCQTLERGARCKKFGNHCLKQLAFKTEYLQCVCITRALRDDPELFELPGQQREHGGVYVVQTDARIALRQTGQLHLQHGLIQLSLSRTEPGHGTRS